MKVIALKHGYFGKLISPGEEFDVPNDAKGSWFQPVEQEPINKEPAGNSKTSRAKDGKNTITDLV